jgi:2-succinyl-5-enolpyruvyl-6-hydroxy-3-cyclohexene-1-carboxylate synthase
MDVGAPQAIDQTHLYGGAVRWFHAPGVADADATPRWRALAARAHAEATGAEPGPVHLDLAFREPLVGIPGALPPARPTGGAWVWRPSSAAPVDAVVDLAGDLAGRRGVIVAGAGSGQRDLVARVAEALGWPVLAAPAAPVWGHPVTVGGVDALLRTEPDLVPDVVVHLGGPLASRVAGEWLARTGAVQVVVAGGRRWTDPHATAAVVLPWAAEAVVEQWADATAGVIPVDDGEWAARWKTAGDAAIAAIDAALEGETGSSEPGIARDLVQALPEGAALVVSSSMPIRDLEWYVRPERALAVHANRGANGIDGVVSTAVGVALADPSRPTALLVGDLAFLHDSNGLLGAAARGVHLVVVVVDNDGGGIFSFLPQATAVAHERFELLYGTPHGLDLVALASSYGVTARAVDEVGTAVTDAVAAGGVHVLVAKTERTANVDLHQRLNAAVANAVAALGGAT